MSGLFNPPAAMRVLFGSALPTAVAYPKMLGSIDDWTSLVT